MIKKMTIQMLNVIFAISGLGFFLTIPTSAVRPMTQFAVVAIISGLILYILRDKEDNAHV